MTRAWVKSRKHDRYYRAAKKQDYRSRAAIKLSQIDREYGLFHEDDVVVDLGAAPGGWSQLALERVGPRGRVIAVDLVRIAPLEGVTIVRGDFRIPAVQAHIFELLRKPADVVVSDMAPRISGKHDYDHARSIELAEAARSFAVRALQPRGDFVAKVFQGPEYPAFLRRVEEDFEAVKGVKPKASSQRSSEIYVLARSRRARVH